MTTARPPVPFLGQHHGMSALLALCACAGLGAQGISSFGASCAPRAPQLSGYGSAVPGQVVELHLTQAAPAAAHVLLAGASNTGWAGGPLPLVIPPGIGFAPGCALRVAPDLALPLAAGSDGRGRLALPLDPALVGASLFFQVLGLPALEAWYATNGVAVVVAQRAAVPVAGRVTRRAGGAAVAGARVTLFTPGLSAFAETRSDLGGSYQFAAVVPGIFRIGCAALDHEYTELDVAAGAAGATQDFVLDPERHPGRWSVIGDTSPEPLDATDIAFLLPDGLLFYCHDTEDPILFDPVTGQKGFPLGSGQAQGCMNGTLLEDGRVIEIGGQDGSDPGSFRNAVRWVKTWAPATGAWLRLPDLLNPTGRWYPGLARLADGSLLIMGGGTRPNAARTNTCEIFDQASQTWRSTGSMGDANEFAPAGLLFNGKVLRSWGGPELYDVAAGTWRPTGAMAAATRGFPGHSDHSLLVLTDGRALAIGINTRTAGPGAAMAETYDAATERWTARSSPALKRMQTETVYLPDGRVLVAGGETWPTPAPVPDRLGIVKWSDLYDPRTDAWRRVADTLEFREYHAITVLVPDGRVVTTGGTRIKFQIGPTTNAVEAYEPPCLFRGVRPVIANLGATTARRGDALTFDVLPAGTRLTAVVLMGVQSTTHWVEGGVPRRLELAPEQGARVRFTLPTDPDALPVGHYLVFAMVDDIPSVARILRVAP